MRASPACRPNHQQLRQQPAQQRAQQRPPVTPRRPVRCSCTSSSAARRPNYFDVLGVPPDASAAEVRAAFRALAKQRHPDVGGDAAAFRLLKRAADTLLSPELRELHSRQLAEAGAPGFKGASPRFARFERWRAEVVPDVQRQLDAWTAEVAALLREAEAALAAAHAQAQQALAAAAGECAEQPQQQQLAAAAVSAMQGALRDAEANVLRLHTKRFEQLQGRYAYPDLVWYQEWEDASEAWLSESAGLQARWLPRLAALQARLGPAAAAGPGLGQEG